ncbi:MAG: hypothetical protein ACREQY_20905, partial [Candidatus Binatia bacterium]
RPRAVAIAGLQGKTVMKRWLRQMFQTSLRVRANPRSYNTEIGLPLAVLDVAIESGRVADAVAAMARASLRGLFSTERLDLLVLEMGIRRPGDARGLLRTLVPEVLILTPLAPSFSSDLPFLDTLEAEVALLAREVVERGGTVVACGDDPRLVAAVSGLGRVRFFRRDQVRRTDGRLALAVSGRSYDVGLDVVGESSEYALLAGIEVAGLLGLEEEKVRKFLAGPYFP